MHVGVLNAAGVALLVVALTGGALVDPAPVDRAPTAEPTPTSEPTPTATPSPDAPAPETTPTPAPTADPAPVAAPTAAMTIERIAGPDRYSTAVAVSQQSFSDGAPVVFLASGIDYPDALSAAPVAAVAGGPLLLTAPTGLPAVVVAELQRLDPARVIIVGAEVAVGARVAQQVSELGFTPERVAGGNRYATARALVRTFIDSSTVAYIATGRNYPDALAAAAAAGSVGAPVLLVNGLASSLDADSLALLDELGVEQAFVAGGPTVVSEGIEAQLENAVTSVERLSGRDRYLTALAINQHAFAEADRAFVATGAGFADALAGAVYAASEQAPLYSSPVVCLPRASLDDITERLQVSRLTLLGGPPALGPRVAAGEACSTEADDRATSIAELSTALSHRMATLSGRYSVSVRELGGLETSVSLNGSDMQEPASVMKLFVAYAVLDRIDEGRLSFATATRSGVSVQECLRVMIHVSDNYCHWDLVALIGNQALNDKFWAEGYTRTVYQGTSGNGSYYSSKRTSTNDVALLLSRLNEGTLLSPASTDHFIELLETQVWRHRLPAGMPPGTPIANKTGYLWVSTGYIHADVGIVTSPHGPIVVAIIGSRNATAAGVRELGRVAYAHFNGPVSTTAAYSDANLITTRTVSYYQNAGNTQLGVIAAGQRVEAYASARDWYRVLYGGRYVYIHSSALRNYYDYPRR